MICYYAKLLSTSSALSPMLLVCWWLAGREASSLIDDDFDAEVTERVKELYIDPSIRVVQIADLINAEYQEKGLNLRLTHSRVERILCNLVALGEVERRKVSQSYAAKVHEIAKVLPDNFTPSDILEQLESRAPPKAKTIIKILDSSEWAERISGYDHRRGPFYKYTGGR